MKKLLYLTAIIVLFAIPACETDTYDLPEETLQGQLTDPDGEPLITEQPNGFQIRLLEDGATQYYDFWGKADGSFRNTKIFKAKYKLFPYNGAFFAIDPVEREISGVTTVDFVVTPYCKIAATIVQDGKNVKATFRINKAAGAGKIKDAQLLVTKWNPNVGIYNKDKNVSKDLKNIPDADIQGADQELVATNYLESGVTYYARVAVLCDNSLGRYNLSAITKIVVP